MKLLNKINLKGFFREILSFWAFLFVLCILLIGVSVYSITQILFKSPTQAIQGEPDEKIEKSVAVPKPFWEVERLLLQFEPTILAPQGYSLQAEMSVECQDEATRRFLETRKYAIREFISEFFLSQDPTSWQDFEKKQKLKADLLKALRNFLKKHSAPGQIEAVYFQNFLIH